MRAIAEAAGLSVHVYTSPHLVRFNERIRIAGELITDEALEGFLDECETANGDAPITFFEITTALAFLAFSRTPADLCLLETGLGGRLDATNVLANPVVTALTPVSIDHVGFLGGDIKGIAAEKAEIMRPDVPAVISAQLPEVAGVIQDASDRIGSRLLRHGMEWQSEKIDGSIRVTMPDKSVTLSSPGLAGNHQIHNAAQAVNCLNAWRPDLVTKEIADKGLRTVEWPGRLQRLTTGPLVQMVPAGWEVWLDGGHNPAAGQVLAAQAEEWGDTPLHSIMGMISTKDPGAFIAPLASHLTSLQTIRIEGEEAAIDPSELAGIAQEYVSSARATPSLEMAVQNAVTQSSKPGRILICGSLYLAGQVLREND